jgi:hypothetical protein
MRFRGNKNPISGSSVLDVVSKGGVGLRHLRSPYQSKGEGVGSFNKKYKALHAVAS